MLQLLSYKAYAAAKRAGTLHSLLESMQPPEVVQAGSLKRKDHPEAIDVEPAAPKTGDSSLNPLKKLKTSVSNCKMM